MRATTIVTVVTVAVLATSARADDRIEQAKQQVKTADIDYRLGRFTEALDGYTRAYEIYPVPALLFNIAQCHRNLKDYAKAIFFYEGYLRDEPTARNGALVQDLIRESRAELDKRSQATPPVEPPVAVPPPSVAAPPPPVVPARAEPQVVVATPQDHRGSRVWPSLLVGGGLAAGAGGAVFYYYGQKRGADEKYVYDDTRALGAALVVIGSAAVVTGAVVWLGRPSTPVAAITPDGGYLGWAGAF